MTRPAFRRWCLAAVSVVAWLFVPGVVRNGMSQWTMTPAYSTYTSVTSDGTYIYTSVRITGTTNGTCPNEPAQLANVCHSTTHSPKVYNVLGGVGGWQTGSSVSWNSYINMNNNQQIAAAPATEYTFTSTAQVDCSVVGTIYSVPSAGDYVSLKTTYGKLAGDKVVGPTRFCTYALACSNNVTPACAQSGWVMPTSSALNCFAYARSTWLAVRKSTSSSFNCFSIATFSAAGAGNCDQ